MKSLLDTTEWSYNPQWLLDDDHEESIWRDSSISMKAKGLFAYMKTKPPLWDFSCKRIASEMRDSLNTVQKAMKELEDFGYLNRMKLGSGRLNHTLSAAPYIGIEPQIERSSLDRCKILMHVEDSLYPQPR
ncbi:MAG: hypothetical protein DRH97_00820 [Chloroflexi bacterium]|nr:MAG: hypothetical protein DRH97_00820 [Chloroflexota bacterium]